MATRSKYAQNIKNTGVFRRRWHYELRQMRMRQNIQTVTSAAPTTILPQMMQHDHLSGGEHGW